MDRLEITVIPVKEEGVKGDVLLGTATDALGKEIGRCRQYNKEDVKKFMGDMLDHYLQERCTQ